MFSLWLSRNTIGFYIWILYFAILVSLLVLIVLHTIHSKCLYSRSCPHANRDSLISCSSGYIILLSVCGPFILLSTCGPGKAHSTKPNGSLESMFPLVPPWNKAPAYKKNARRMSLSQTCYFLVWFSGSSFALSRAPSPHFPAQRWWSLSLSLCQFKCLFSTVNMGHSDWEDNVNHLIQWSCIKTAC